MKKVLPDTQIIIIDKSKQGHLELLLNAQKLGCEVKGPCDTCSYNETCDKSTYFDDLDGSHGGIRNHFHEYCSNWTDDLNIKVENTYTDDEKKRFKKEHIDPFFNIDRSQLSDLSNIIDSIKNKKEKGLRGLNRAWELANRSSMAHMKWLANCCSGNDSEKQEKTGFEDAWEIADRVSRNQLSWLSRDGKTDDSK